MVIYIYIYIYIYRTRAREKREKGYIYIYTIKYLYDTYAPNQFFLHNIFLNILRHIIFQNYAQIFLILLQNSMGFMTYVFKYVSKIEITCSGI